MKFFMKLYAWNARAWAPFLLAPEVGLSAPAPEADLSVSSLEKDPSASEADLSSSAPEAGTSPSASCPASLPAAYDGFARQRQIQEASPDFKGQRVLQGVAIDDEGHVILLAQQIPKVSAVLGNGRSCCLKQQLRVGGG